MGDHHQVTATKSGINKRHPKTRAETTKAILLPQRRSNRRRSEPPEPPDPPLYDLSLGPILPTLKAQGLASSGVGQSHPASRPVRYPNSSSHRSKGDGICGIPEFFSTQARFPSSISAASSSTMRFLAFGTLADILEPSGICNPVGPPGFTTNKSAPPDSDSSS
jgi:hypothetical protein